HCLGMFRIIIIKLFQHIYCFFLLMFCFRICVYTAKHQFPQICKSLLYIRRHLYGVLIQAVFNYIVDKSVQAFPCGITQKHSQSNRNIVFSDDTGSLSIIHVMVKIRDLVRKTHDLTFQGSRTSTGTVVQDSVPYLPCQVQSFSFFFQNLNHPDTLFIVGKTAGMYLVERMLPRMSKRSMSQIMSQSNGFHKIFIQSQRLGNGPGNLGNFQRMGKTVPVMVSLRSQKNLSFIFKTTESLTVQNPVPVTLIDCSYITFLFLTVSSPGMDTVGGPWA